MRKAKILISTFSKSTMCPGKGMMGGFAPNIPHVSMWGMPNFANGGMVQEDHVNIPDGILKKDDPDRVLVRLMPGELVIPKKHVSLVRELLRSKKIKLPGM